MDPNILGIIVGLVSLVFLLSGMPIAFALGVPSVLFILLFMDIHQFDLIAHTMFDGLNDFGLLAIPLFILMGSIIANTKSGEDLYEGLHRWLNRLPGGLAISNIVSCAIFSALCGSSPATAAAIGTMGIPEMRKRGYPDSLATGCIVAGGTLGILIPPSVTMIIYGIATQTSIGKLFLAGVIPGIVITVMMCVWVVLYSQWAKRKMVCNRINPGVAGGAGAEFFESVTYSWKEKVSAISRVVPFIFLIVIIMGSLYGGWATPSEAAGVGSVAALFLVMAIYRIGFKNYGKILHMTIKESTMILMIIAASFLFGAVMTKLYITQSIINAIVGADLSKWPLMIMINLFLLVLGCFMPPVAIILILAPILYPVLVKYGFDPIWFGVIMTINMEVGLITPPVGLNLYIVQGIAPDVPLGRVLAGSVPFVLVLLLGIVICSIWPELTLWLPNKMITR
ncbi:MAG: TRAP transporter large permease [Proteobacteria bacterium]|nr:TRAP transporter large permease [Pseudomonadota bacterium]MBU2228171.1 TRAP transporter large permease [Pseudomonadota bacterium]MBU2260828.1 TRAP transporter large permease [Pseudomonadota bacterium]